MKNTGNKVSKRNKNRKLYAEQLGNLAMGRQANEVPVKEQPTKSMWQTSNGLITVMFGLVFLFWIAFLCWLYALVYKGEESDLADFREENLNINQESASLDLEELEMQQREARQKQEDEREEFLDRLRNLDETDYKHNSYLAKRRQYELDQADMEAKRNRKTQESRYKQKQQIQKEQENNDQELTKENAFKLQQIKEAEQFDQLSDVQKTIYSRKRCHSSYQKYWSLRRKKQNNKQNKDKYEDYEFEENMYVADIEKYCEDYDNPVGVGQSNEHLK